MLWNALVKIAFALSTLAKAQPQREMPMLPSTLPRPFVARLFSSAETTALLFRWVLLSGTDSEIFLDPSRGSVQWWRYCQPCPWLRYDVHSSRWKRSHGCFQCHCQGPRNRSGREPTSYDWSHDLSVKCFFIFQKFKIMFQSGTSLYIRWFFSIPLGWRSKHVEEYRSSNFQI